MSKFRFSLNALVSAVFVLAFASMAHAQTSRTFVSGVGDDVNPCSRTAPCKTFAGAISKTAKDGEINALDPGGFGVLTITKSITVNGRGTMASVLSAGSPGGFTINITDPADVRKQVRLLNVNINGVATGQNGIRFIAGLALHVRGVEMYALTTDGIVVTTAAASELFVSETAIMDAAGNGINVNANSVTGQITDVSTNNCNNGVRASGTNTKVGITRLTASGNVAVGVTSENAATITMDNSIVTNNGTGVRAQTSNATLNIGNNTISGNGTSVAIASGTVNSYRDNRLINNGSNGQEASMATATPN